ncbi:MAG: helix-turn-helix transcriptional regulator [Alphaproteobacteria bacterium]
MTLMFALAARTSLRALPLEQAKELLNILTDVANAPIDRRSDVTPMKRRPSALRVHLEEWRAVCRISGNGDTTIVEAIIKGGVMGPNNTPIRPIAETDQTVTLKRSDYLALLDRIEDAEDEAAILAADARGSKGDALSVVVVDRLINGENPIRVWREHRGMTVASLAHAIGVSSTYLNELESGRKLATTRLLEALAKSLGVELEDLSPTE